MSRLLRENNVPGFPSVFAFSQILLTAVIALAVSGVILRGWFREIAGWEALVIALIVGASVLIWRLVGNVAQLNDDPVPPFSPNDLLCPIVTYVFLGLYAGFHMPDSPARWARVRALLTMAVCVINVLAI
jgi:hypothetical protein